MLNVLDRQAIRDDSLEGGSSIDPPTLKKSIQKRWQLSF
jgi:hypothetical protein